MVQTLAHGMSRSVFRALRLPGELLRQLSEALFFVPPWNLICGQLGTHCTTRPGPCGGSPLGHDFFCIHANSNELQHDPLRHTSSSMAGSTASYLSCIFRGPCYLSRSICFATRRSLFFYGMPAESISQRFVSSQRLHTYAAFFKLFLLPSLG